MYGVVNQGSDVYATEEIDSPTVFGAQSLTPLPPAPQAENPWSISASTAPSPDGTLLVYVSVPGAGALSASAVAAGALRAARHRVSRHRVSKHRRKARRARAPANVRIAQTAMPANGPGVFELHLIPAARYRSLLAGKRGLYATITVTFTAPGHRRLRLILRASFPHRPAIYNVPIPGYGLPHAPPRRHKAHPKHSGRRR